MGYYDPITSVINQHVGVKMAKEKRSGQMDALTTIVTFEIHLEVLEEDAPFLLSLVLGMIGAARR